MSVTLYRTGTRGVGKRVYDVNFQPTVLTQRWECVGHMFLYCNEVRVNTSDWKADPDISPDTGPVLLNFIWGVIGCTFLFQFLVVDC